MLYLYDETSSALLNLWKNELKLILKCELGLLVRRTRFEFQNKLWPIELVLFEQTNLLGNFDPIGLRIGLHKQLFYRAKTEVIKNVLRHELAHYFCHITYGGSVQNHGKEYREICRSFGWGNEVYSASASIEIANQLSGSDPIFENLSKKIKKLLALAQSSNPHESQLATSKANQLLLKYGLEKVQEPSGEEKTYLKTVLKMKKATSKYGAIYEILKTFYVAPIFNYYNDGVALEVVGEYGHVEMANYVASYLNNEIDRSWEHAKKENPDLRGVSKKDAFMRGMTKGYLEKIEQAKQDIVSKHDLIILSKNLDKHIKRAFPRLSTRTTKTKRDDPRAQKLGQKAGKDLNIHKPVSNSSNSIKLLEY